MGDSSFRELVRIVPEQGFPTLLAAFALFAWVGAVLGTRKWVHWTWIASLVCGFSAGVLQTMGPLSVPEPLPRLIAVTVLAILALYFLFRHNIMADEKQIAAFRPLATVFLACILVSIFSGELGSASRMKTLMIHLGVDPILADSIMFTLRKGIHLSFYAVNGGMVMAAALMSKEPRLVAVRTALLFAFGVACFDEYRQLGSPGRGPSITDVGIDTLGATIGIGIASLVRRKP